jgi:cytochrome P450
MVRVHLLIFLLSDARGGSYETTFCSDRTILHNPRIYPFPEKFMPERFLGLGKDSEQVMHLDVAFGKLSLISFGSSVTMLLCGAGYGRRICPGRFMAEAQLWITIVSVLSVFVVQAPPNDVGKRVNIQPEFASGMIR